MDDDMTVDEALYWMKQVPARRGGPGSENARKVRELAARLGIKEDAARKRLYRAKQARTNRVTWQVTAHQDDREAIDKYIAELNRRRVAQERAVAALKSKAANTLP